MVTSSIIIANFLTYMSIHYLIEYIISSGLLVNTLK